MLEFNHYNKIHICIRSLVVAILLVFFNSQVYAQVGINNNDPNPHSVLDVKATDKGMLIPRMTTGQRETLLKELEKSSTKPEGLMVYDTDEDTFYFYYPKVNIWIPISPWKVTGANQHLNSTQTGNIGIGTAATPLSKLSVSGNIAIGENYMTKTAPGNGAIIEGNVGIGVDNPTQKLDVNGGVKASGAIQATSASIGGPVTGTKGTFSDTVKAAIFDGVGSVPKGAILMWSGDPLKLPDGWALCDGSSGRPDLRGKFIVGYHPDSADYSTVGNKGGEREHALTLEEMPRHNHTNGGFQNLLRKTGRDTAPSAGDNSPTEPDIYSAAPMQEAGGMLAPAEGRYVTKKFTCNCDPELNKLNDCPAGLGCGDTWEEEVWEESKPAEYITKPHENRPPYYVIAYIIRL